MLRHYLTLLARQAPRPSPAPRPILPSFLVLAGACPLVFAGSSMGVNLCGCTAMRTSSCLTPRIVVASRNSQATLDLGAQLEVSAQLRELRSFNARSCKVALVQHFDVEVLVGAPLIVIPQHVQPLSRIGLCSAHS